MSIIPFLVVSSNNKVVLPKHNDNYVSDIAIGVTFTCTEDIPRESDFYPTGKAVRVGNVSPDRASFFTRYQEFTRFR